MQIALWIDTPALGDTIAAIPTLRKLSQAYDNQKITVFTSKPFLFEGHPLVEKALKSDADKSDYKVYRTFNHLVGKNYNQYGTDIEFRYSNMDLRQFHAVSLGFTLTEEEMDMDLYIETPRELDVKDYIIIHPTHTWATRTWDQEKWQELIDRLNEHGIPVVAVGRDAKEVGFFNTDKPVMPINIKYGANLLNDDANDPAELRWMMNNRARGVVTMDSGILHVAGTTDVNIIQLGSSIDNRLRAPYRNGSQDYKYKFVRGGCGEFCSSNMKYNVAVHGSIQGIPPQVKCLANKPTFECHPSVDQVFNAILELYTENELKNLIKKEQSQNIDPSRIALLAMYDTKYLEMAKHTAYNNFAKYCKLRGYTLEARYISKNKSGRTSHWSKIYYMKELLESGNYDYVFFLDLDCIIMNNLIKLEDFIDDKHFMWIPNHDFTPNNNEGIFNGVGNGIMTAQFIMKACDRSIDFLQDVIDAKEVIADNKLHVFDYEMRQVRISINKPEFKDGVKILEERLLNTFWTTDNPWVNITGNRIEYWKQGDFIVHVPGYFEFEKRVQLLKDLSYFSGAPISNLNVLEDRIQFTAAEDINEHVKIIVTLEDDSITNFSFEDGLRRNCVYSLYIRCEGREAKIFAKLENSNTPISLNLVNFKPQLPTVRSFITHTTENYEDVVLNMAKSIEKYSQYPLVVYTIDYDASLALREFADCRRIDLNLPAASSDDFKIQDGIQYVNRDTFRTYATLSSKVEAMIQATEDGIDEWVYMDGDCVANYNVDDLFNYVDQIEDYPLATKGPHQYVMMVKNGQLIGNPFIDDKANGLDTTKCLEWPLMEFFGMRPEQRTTNYRTTNILLANNNCLEFLKKWRDIKNALPSICNLNKYLPYHEETLFNVLVWQRSDKSLPMVYINITGAKTVEDFFSTADTNMLKSAFYRLPEDKRDIKVFHGEKRADEIEGVFGIVDKFINPQAPTKLLYLAPHLSTGGMPEFLLARLKVMHDDPNYDVHVVEYTKYADSYVVQRNQIQDMLGSNFHPIAHLGEIEQPEREERLKQIATDIQPDVIHIEESPEAFDGFNKMSAETQEWLYQPSQPWKIVETCHNIWFNPKENKRYSPDAYLFVTPHHSLETFSEEPSEKFEAFYPIIPQTKSEDRRRKSLEILGLEDLSNAKHIVNIGLWTPGKNQGEAVAWAQTLEALYPGEYQFHFVGNQASNFAQYWEPIMATLPPNVHIWGERSDVDTFYQLADAVVFNSTWECNPLALRQALGYDIPVMARNLPQYHTMYNDCLTEIQGDNADPLRLVEALKTPIHRKQNAQAQAVFKQEHIDAYTSVLKNPVKRTPHTREEYTITWQNGPTVTSKTGRELNVEFWAEGQLVYSATLQNPGHWAKPAVEWYRDWTVIVDGQEHRLELEGQAAMVQFNSSSLGDTLSWVEVVREFRFKNRLQKVYLATHKNWIFDQDWYRTQGIEFVEPGNMPDDAVAFWSIGVYMEDPPGTAWFPNRNKRDWRKIYLGDIAADHLGVGRIERSPRLSYTGKHIQERPYICIATKSTAQAKYWNNPTGWQDLVNHYNAKGYDVYHLSKEGTDLEGVIQAPIEFSEVYKLLQGAEMFYGISSGLSWFAWATDCPVVLISGFTPEECEFQNEKTLRIINKDVCNGCWAWDHFNRGDWNWCPTGKDTERHFECTKSISAQSVIEQVQQWQEAKLIEA